jgi:cytochrome c553
MPFCSLLINQEALQMKKFVTQFLSAVVLFGMICTVAAYAEDLTDNPNYKARCKICHGADAEGKPAMKIPALKTRASKTEAELMKAIEEGNDTSKPKMPPFKEKLTADDIKALVAEIKALK